MGKMQSRLLSALVVSGMMLCTLISGCSPEMRRKFIRERKTDANKNAVIPVLDPMEYPNTMETFTARYDYFYALLKVWQKDALMLLDDAASDKQMRHALEQVKIQLQELGKLFDGRVLRVIKKGIQDVDDILTQYDRPPALRNVDIIRRDIQRLSDNVIKPLTFETVRHDLKEYNE